MAKEICQEEIEWQDSIGSNEKRRSITNLQNKHEATSPNSKNVKAQKGICY